MNWTSKFEQFFRIKHWDYWKDVATDASQWMMPRKMVRYLGPRQGQQQDVLQRLHTHLWRRLFRVYCVVWLGHYFIQAVELNVRILRLSRKRFRICFRVCFDNSIVWCRHWLPPLCCNNCWKLWFSQILAACSSPETKDKSSCSSALKIKLAILCNDVGPGFTILCYRCDVPFSSENVSSVFWF